MKNKALANNDKKPQVAIATMLLSGCQPSSHPDKILESLGKMLLQEQRPTPAELRGPNDNVSLGMTLYEFDNGALLAGTVPARFKTFAIDMMCRLRNEYHCKTTSENATAELVVANFVHVLEVQERVTTCLAQESIDNLTLQYLAILGKERERANRDYLLALQQLRSLKQAPIQINVKAQTAIVGSQQIVQANNHGEDN